MATVLIVEDEESIRRFAAVNLTARGYAVIEADNARDGLDMLRDRLPELVLLDMRMPGMDGFDLLEAKAQDPDIANTPVIVLTASMGAADAVEGEYTGVVAVLHKPISASELIEAVATTLSTD
jgi:two-component system alkaline phosphatase synthesis response regulator PhoP